MDHLTYPTEADKQKALEVIDELIQRTESETNRALYRKQRERIVSASVEDRQGKVWPTLGPFPKG